MFNVLTRASLYPTIEMMLRILRHTASEGRFRDGVLQCAQKRKRKTRGLLGQDFADSDRVKSGLGGEQTDSNHRLI